MMKMFHAFALRKNGEKYPLRLEAREIPYKGKNVRVVEFRDITEQKITEEELTKLSIAVQQSPVVIIITDLAGNIEYVNPIFVDITGYTLEEVIGKKTNILKQANLSDENYSELWNTISSGKVWHGEFHNKKKNGEFFWERASVSPIRNSQGQIINYIKVAEDISEIKIKEQELRSALEKAKESDRLKSAFLSNMSHEIRTPMNGILGFTQLLKEPQLTGNEKDTFINIIEKSGNRMLNTINDIIDISKIESGQVEVYKTEISVNKILEEQYDFFIQEAKSKGLELIYQSTLSDSESKLITDKHKVEGILSNLIKNAIKFTKRGSITFGCFLKTIDDSTSMEIFVSDTGVGISQSRIKAIFNRFEQADIEDINVYEGSGLGLAISKSYIELLGGKIEVFSKKGSGSTFRFTIPYTKNIAMEVK
ncbi:MAG: PAS domain S-box protein [Bacteroidetes bacterium]|nr:PAS domain S-box protein [Bacteroidota bacterium]MBT6687679.1 PAS domain S-box protein [Bacteroidota bacterium]MBT7142499.1 PAS domain S-box protein [Bacteroidota bacterium]MBT7493448.1 PAS domain S-box protein [Bacteroidota bacterium]